MTKQLWAPWRLEYIKQADEQPGCVFCDAAAGDDEERLVVHRGEHAFVLLNKFPYSSGHLMVAPTATSASSPGLRTRRRWRSTVSRSRGVAALGEVYGPEGHNLGWNLGRVAGAGVVDHIHLHVVPRWAGDTNFMPVLATDVKVLPEYHRRAVQGVAALGEVYGPEGHNLGWNLGRVAGAGVVDHIHLHVVPRWAGDTNFMPVLADVKVLPEHLLETRRRLVEAWPS